MATLPPDTRAVGTPDPAGDMNAVVDCLATITGATPGGAAVTTQQALDTLAGGVTNNRVLAGNGTHVTLRALAAADLPTGTTSAQGALQLDGTAGDITQAGTAAAAGAVGKAADAGHTHADPNPLPADFGFVAWSADPGNVAAAAAPTAATITLIMVLLRKTATITNIVVSMSTAGATLTSGQNFAGIYDSTGTQRGVTADQTTPWTGSVGTKIMPLTTPFSNAPAGTYYVAILSNGTTPPTFRASATNATLANTGLSGAGLRFATNGTGTTLPASLTLSSNSTTNTAPVCVVLT